MLKEIEITDIPERGTFCSAPTPTSIFCEKTLNDFMRSPIKTAEVLGWPNGDPTSSKMAASCFSSMQSKIKNMKLENIQVIVRGKRIFIMKTIVRKVDEHD